MHQSFTLLTRLTQILCVLLLLGGCDFPSFPGKKANKPDGEIALALPFDPLSLDPLGPDWARQSGLIKALFPQLFVEERQAGSFSLYHPYLASTWEIGEDRQSLSFKLNPDAKWSDGKKITPIDVKTSLDMQRDPHSAWPLAQALSGISEVKVLGETQVVVLFDSPQVEPLAHLNLGVIIPAHVFGSRKPESVGPWLKVTGGAFRVRGAKHIFKEGRGIYPTGLPVLLEPDPHCIEGICAKLAEVRLSFEPEGDVRSDGFFEGRLDYLPGVPAHRLVQIEDSEFHKFVVTGDRSFSMITWNTQIKPFDNADVRRALTMAINRQSLVDDLLRGAGKVSPVPMSSEKMALPKDLVPLFYDPEGAISLLKSRGLEDSDGDGWLEFEGAIFQVELLRNEGNPLADEISLRIREDLRRIGIQVVLKSVPEKALVKRGVGGDFEALLLNFRVEEPFDLSIFAQGENLGSGNLGKYVSEELKSRMSTLKMAASPSEFQRGMGQVLLQIQTDHPVTILFERLRVDGMASDMLGVRPGTEPYHNLHHWARVKETLSDTQ